MSDDPNQTGRDRQTVSDQVYELQHIFDVLEAEHPQHDRSVITEVVAKVKEDIAPSTDRERIIKGSREALASWA